MNIFFTYKFCNSSIICSDIEYRIISKNLFVDLEFILQIFSILPEHGV